MKKKWVALLLCAALALLGGSALGENPESDYTYYPESEACVGTWYVDDYILEIAHNAEDYNVYTCVVTQYGADGRTGVRWSYDVAAYDDIGRALSTVEIGVKANLTFDDFGEVASSEQVYDDGAASFGINDAGKLVWKDYTAAPGEDELVFEKVVTGQEERPEDAYIGTWVADRATLTIEDLDDVIYCTARWANSAFEEVRWEYENCLYDESSGGLTTPETGVRTTVTFDESGEAASTREEYRDGAASFTLNGEGRLVWTDLKEASGENEVPFERVPEASEDAD